MAFRKRPGDRKPLDPEPDKPKVKRYSAAELRAKWCASPERERQARAFERGLCE